MIIRGKEKRIQGKEEKRWRRKKEENTGTSWNQKNLSISLLIRKISVNLQRVLRNMTFYLLNRYSNYHLDKMKSNNTLSMTPCYLRGFPHKIVWAVVGLSSV